MNYPVWDVPLIGGVGVIGLISVFHVMISHFAVGGGLYLPMAEAKAYRDGREDWLIAIKRHSRFFLILTAVFGAVSGVGIWFAIGLASPEATSTLIHNFVFGWAIEWVFFIIELTCAAVYYYTWDRIPRELHLKVGWLYAIASFLTLVIINGILTFMLTPGATWLGVAGTGAEASKFWNAFFNPTYWPSLFLRICVCLSQAGLYALLTSSLLDSEKEPKLKTELVRWSTRWLTPSFILMPILFLWYLAMVPESQRALLQLGMSTIGQGTFTQVTRTVLITVMTSATIVGVVYLFAYRHPLDFTFGHGCAVLLLALAATGSTEQARELLRKPWVIVQHMYSNGIRQSEVARMNSEGYLAKSPWVRKEEHLALAKVEALIASRGVATLAPADSTSPFADARIVQTQARSGDAAVPAPATDAAAAQAAVAALAPQEKLARLGLGEVMYRGQCMSCHTTDGYRAMRQLLAGRDRKSINSIVQMLHKNAPDSPYARFMPPVVGKPAEVEALIDYLTSLVQPGGEKLPAKPATTAPAKSVAAVAN